jgi:hypothetical protein
MLAGFRTFAKSPFAVVLFGLLIVSFAVFGISDVFKGPASPASSRGIALDVAGGLQGPVRELSQGHGAARPARP